MMAIFECEMLNPFNVKTDIPEIREFHCGDIYCDYQTNIMFSVIVRGK